LKRQIDYELEAFSEIEWPSRETIEKATEDISNTLIAKKRTMEEMKGGVSEEDIDAWKKQRTDSHDPMAKFLGKDELL
jgi:pre-mRNA-processing factor SLU7